MLILRPGVHGGRAGFKLGAVPFHMWMPDVYHGAPTAVTLLIGSRAQARRLRVRDAPAGAGAAAAWCDDWQGMLVIMAVLSIAIGNIAAIAQTNLKRMLAYSTISHMGFLLLGIMSGTLNGYASPAMFYVLVYVLMTLGAFGMILLLSRTGFEAENLDDLKGLNQRSPWYAFMMLLLMFSMAGRAAARRLLRQVAVLQAAVQAGHGLAGGVGGAVVADRRLLLPARGQADVFRRAAGWYADRRAARHGAGARVNGLAVLVLGLMPQRLMELCAYAILHSIQ